MAKKKAEPVKPNLERFEHGFRSEYLVGGTRVRVTSVMGDKPLAELLRMCVDERALAEHDHQARNS